MNFLLLVAVIVGLYWFWAHSRKIIENEAEEEYSALISEKEKLNDWIVANQKLPEVEANLVLKSDEFCIHSEHSSLYEIKTDRYTVGAGTRLKIGRLPLYLGGSKSVSSEIKKNTAFGLLHITNKRLIFIGDSKNLTINLSDLISFETATYEIKISSSRAKSNVMFSVMNGYIWNIYLSVLPRWQLENNSITHLLSDSDLLPA